MHSTAFLNSAPKSAPSLRPVAAALLAMAIGAAAVAAPPADQLRTETSAFLRANADSLVAWQPWGEAAFARAQQEKKPLFVAVGAFTSELSRAMSRQSFAQPETAALLNATFVCVLVDREEHPEVAAYLANYVHVVKQLDGSPLNVWLTPELQPYDGATYLPPNEEWGKSSFLKTAQGARDAWVNDAKACRARGADAVKLLSTPEPALPAKRTDAAKLKEELATAAGAWRDSLDAAHGGFGDPPRNPEPELVRFLLRQSPADRAAAVATLKAIAGGALRDPLDGGFFRNTTDAAWRLPYTQKLLADQARIALAFLDAAQVTGDASFVPAARGALDYVLAGLARPDGTFAAAEDATAGETGSYYAWTEAEINAVLGTDAAAFKTAQGVSAAGNVSADDDLSTRYQGVNLLSSAAATDAAVAQRLLTARNRRPAPPRDEQATAGAHGLLLAALARAGRQLDEPRYLDAAVRTLDALKKHFLLNPAGDLRRLADSPAPAAPVDYAAVALGCRELARTSRKTDADALAGRLLARAGEQFLDARTGRFFATPASLPAGILVRPFASNPAPTAEPVALAAGAPPAQAEALAAALAVVLEQGAAPTPGEVLLALAPN